MREALSIIFGIVFCFLSLSVDASESDYRLLSESIQNRALHLSVAVSDSKELDSRMIDILEGRLDPGFVDFYSNRYISKGFSKSTILIRVDLLNDTDTDDFILNLGNSHLDHVELYQLSNPNRRIGGDYLPFSEWELPEIRISFPIRIPPGERDSILIKINTSSAINIKPTIEEPANFYKYLSSTKTLYGFFYGSIGIMIVYNFIIFLLIREKVYFYYSAAIFSNLGIQVFINGMDLYLLGEIPELRNSAGGFFVGASAFTGVYFAREFLNTMKNMPKLDRVLKYYALVAIIITAISIFILERSYAVISANLIAQVFSLMILYTIIRGMILGVKQARLFFVAWGFLLVGIILFALLEAGAVPYNFFTVFSNQFGSVMEATILSIAMAERLRILKKEKEEAQEQAFQNLEQVVQDRTKQLNDTLREIQKDIHMAKRIQMDSLPDDDWTSRRILFARIFRPMSIIGGDTYDITKISEGRYRIFLADATGHGVQAALITMAIRSEYQAIKRTAPNPGDLLKQLNYTFLKEYYSLNIVFSCCVVDIDVMEGKLEFSSAGHPSQLLVKDKNPISLDKTGRIIGLSLDSHYKIREYNIAPQDRLYLYTDGILEQENHEGNEFGEGRLFGYLSNHHYKDISTLMKEIEITFDSYRAEVPQSDDLTILCMEIKNAPD